MLKNWKDKILSFAAGALIACTGFAVAGLVNNGEGSMSENASIMQNWFSDGDELGWVSSGIVSAKAEELNADEPCLTIVSNNVEYGSELFLQYAVPKTVDGIAVKMLYWVKAQTEYTYEAHQAQSAAFAKLRDNGPSGVTDQVRGYSQCYVFKFPMAPKEATRYIYARPYYEKTNEDGSIEYIYGDVLKYSILDYAYNMMARDTVDTRVNLVKQLLNYAGAAQKHLSSNPSKLATDTYYYVGFAKGVTATIVETGEHIRKEGAYAPTEVVTIQAPAKDENGTEFLAWRDQDGKAYGDSKSTTYQLSISEISKNLILEPVYKLPWEITNGHISGYTGYDKEVFVPNEYWDAVNGAFRSVTVVDSNTFKDNTTIEKVTFAEKITYIQANAFYSCPNLKIIELPSTVKSLKGFVYDCRALTAINVASGNEHYANYENDGNVYELDDSNNAFKLVQYATGKAGSYYVPETVTAIGQYAFRSARELERVYIHANVTTVEADAFKANASTMVIAIQNMDVVADWHKSWKGGYDYITEEWSGKRD